MWEAFQFGKPATTMALTALTSGSGQGCSALALESRDSPSFGVSRRVRPPLELLPHDSTPGLTPDLRHMMTLIGRRPWAFAALYMVVSLLVEMVLIVVVGWKVPTDNAQCAGSLDAPTLAGREVLRLSPAAQGFPDGRRAGGILTLLITVVLNRLSGVTTGLAEPILNRSVAAWLAGAMTNQVRQSAFETGR